MSIFKDKVLLITGRTGSFWDAVLNRFLRTDIGEIRIFSRDEKKQDDMRHDFGRYALVEGVFKDSVDMPTIGLLESYSHASPRLMANCGMYSNLCSQALN